MQQDPQEFGKLFMAKVEECCGTRKNFIADLFRGDQQYVTQCCACRARSTRDANFDELEVAIAGQSNVQDCVKSYLQNEYLEGDNQYFCDACGGKRDATRCVVIKKAPKVLSVQLLRYVYDRVTWEKKKLRDGIETNATIEVTEDGREVPYDLVAIVRRRGRASRGSPRLLVVECLITHV